MAILMGTMIFISMEFEGTLFSDSPKSYVRGTAYLQNSVQIASWKSLFLFFFFTCFDGGALPIPFGLANITEESTLLARCFFFFKTEMTRWPTVNQEHSKWNMLFQNMHPNASECWIDVETNLELNMFPVSWMPSIHSNYGNGKSMKIQFWWFPIDMSSCK